MRSEAEKMAKLISDHLMAKWEANQHNIDCVGARNRMRDDINLTVAKSLSGAVLAERERCAQAWADHVSLSDPKRRIFKDMLGRLTPPEES